MINLSGPGITIVHTHSNQQASTFRCRGKYKRAFDGGLRWQGPQREARQRREKLNKKSEGEDFSFRRESVRRFRRHSLRSGVWVLQQREIPLLEYSKREKVWEWTSMGFLLRFCLSLSPPSTLSHSLTPTLPSTPHLGVTVSARLEQEAVISGCLSNFPLPLTSTFIIAFLALRGKT